MGLLSITVSPLVTVQMSGAAADIRVHQSGPASSRPVAPGLVGWKLVRPELSPHLSYLVASLLAFWIGDEHVIVPPVGEHLSTSAADSLKSRTAERYSRCSLRRDVGGSKA